MFWVFALLVTSLASLLVFSLRHTNKKIYGFPAVQFVYLFISAPLISVCLINIAYLVAGRPGVENVIPDIVLLSLFVFSVVMGAIGSGIHSIVVTMGEVLISRQNSEAYEVCERIHGLLSHEMLYLNQMLITFLLVLLELNHPLHEGFYSLEVLLLGGLAVGVILGMSVVLSTIVKINLIFGSLLVLMLVPVSSTIYSQWYYYPVAVVGSVGLIVGMIIMLLASLIFNYSPWLTKTLITWFFPNGHKLRAEILSR